jgi:hypothetical protein
MVKGWRPGAKRMSWDGRIETARAPTEDEESALFFALMDWQETHPDSMGSRLWHELRGYFEWHMTQRPWSRRQIKQVRWAYVRHGRYHLGLRWGEAYQYASTWCEGSPAEGSPRTMREDYSKEQRTNKGHRTSAPELRSAARVLRQEPVTISQKHLRRIVADVARELRQKYFPAPQKRVVRSRRTANR